MAFQWTYTDFEAANEAVEVAIKETIRDNPTLTEDEIAWDLTQAIMYDCDDATMAELSQRTGVSRIRR